MKYTPKQAPEGINYSKEHPLKELALLLSAATLIIIVVIYLLFASTDYLVKFVPFSIEQQLFQRDMFEDNIKPDENKKWAEQEQYLQNLVEKMQAANGDDEFRFKVYIVDMKMPNAFAFPGGYIGVTPALLDTVQSENGLAMVLGHEIGHHYARDPLKGVGKAVLLAMVMYTLTGFGNDEWLQELIGQISAIGIGRFSRDQERRADETGKALLLKYYGHVGGATEFFENMKTKKSDASKGLSFYDTHPPTQERIDSLSMGEQLALVPLPEFVKP